MLEAKDLREKGIKELQELLKKTRKELMTILFQISAGGQKDRSLAGKKRKDIARIFTVLNEKEKN